ncbi:elongation factor P maturation arginine rhamnosyltransferase EarP [Hydrogenophaga sp. A37]|uniref:elongation factor P maturation arginine rhamnosyltransferase EarP n=1 Tax=Hydrogenophaga sp. A37 TaxID=1945864 RepID=UPI000986928F
MRWDIFCKVIDNLGDIGVCWRFCAELAASGQTVRLWIDQPDDLGWMVPGALEGHVDGVQVLHWTEPLASGLLAGLPPADVWIETFGCHPPPEALEHRDTAIAAGGQAPVWVNLEYMSAESYVERCHRLPSLVSTGPMRGVGKWFFYPGFTPATGGLLRENDLPERQAAFDAHAWLGSRGLPHTDQPRASLFCYEPSALPSVLRQAGDTASDWLVTAGRAGDAVATAQAQGLDTGLAVLQRLPRLTQRDYDHLLWSCDLNFVRGEDSLVRALWAGKPFVWHIYPQHDNAHHAKLDAFLDWLQAPASLREMHHAWNGVTAPATVWPGWEVVHSWTGCVQAARARLLAQPSLSEQLIKFVLEKR